MNFLSALIIITGLGLFEIINSVDNAIINAEVLSTMKPKSRVWFTTWGLFFSVVLVRGLLPFLIVWVLNPNKNLILTIIQVFSKDPQIANSLDRSSPYLLMAGGIFMVFVFFHWLFLEDKHFGLPGEKFIANFGVWFFALISILLSIIVWQALHTDPFLAFSATVGSTLFFITHGFKESAAVQEKKLLKTGMSDVSKLLYLEIIDLAFSIDGILGSFAFTLYVPLILIGNGLGAIMLRQITVSNIGKIKKYDYIKNGAMYSIFLLGSIMVLDSLGGQIPFWFSPLATVSVVGYFYLKSVKNLKSR